MPSNDETDRTTGGLSTDDLAQPAAGGSGADREPPPTGAPVYPGESTAPAGTERPDGDSAADGTGTGTESLASAGTSRAADAPDDEMPQLLTDDEERGFRDRWQEIQGRFVDDPREAVHEADTLVADVMQTLASTFAQHKQDLESQWGQGEKVDTEELRGALRRYRSFFNRLLST
ncbi:hypothetical protein SAMN05428944_1297 [Streptomyces sp. 1222.5]|uniref:hypothetical protein n=1 Tax=unclassified Streptomyces TaxID=2593676 RepID=UPI00089AB838|nr:MULTISPECIES: hypothetical protein [unclassified Streptomyces]PKW11483.1 hypothetical protein BX260_6797 [Streptomyces sp. 5112.2]SEB77830.1 hypothetical protein SAMN05428944_1297 [Streptomyces sp. 1222.5]